MSESLKLCDLGYRFDHNGELRRISDNSRFIFTTQSDYEKLGNVMTNELYSILENRYGLSRFDVFVDVRDKHNILHKYRSFVYASTNFCMKSTVLLIIHGSGAVRPGQWSRRLILNESLDVGSQIPYIQRALSNDWGVVLCNTNTDENFDDYSPQHLRAVHDQLLGDPSIQQIFVVAHSRGGPDFANAYCHFKSDDRIAVVCLTDSTHFEIPLRSSNESEVAGPVFINWRAQKDFESTDLLRNDVLTMFSRVHQIYAGTTEHERSSYSAFDSIFYVLENWKNSKDFSKLLGAAAAMILAKDGEV
ncbi:hypothetical protein DICVIV_03337 [Dictyocaulus viviparus]|uniref:Arb2 domain-containing protein n=1 Tax=Dictyocaulus viviparus TaxID=29172 RepID=A0A0D8Y2T6_DICVI|nr:hypothetical protein DICVIV_03337 [Dictyocaulus viviparus]